MCTLQAEAQVAASKAEADRLSAAKAKEASDTVSASADSLAASLKNCLSDMEKVWGLLPCGLVGRCLPCS
jgi:hypothetical protein